MRLTFTTILLLLTLQLTSCTTRPEFVSGKQVKKENQELTRTIASESPVSKGCFELLKEIIRKK